MQSGRTQKVPAPRTTHPITTTTSRASASPETRRASLSSLPVPAQTLRLAADIVRDACLVSTCHSPTMWTSGNRTYAIRMSDTGVPQLYEEESRMSSLSRRACYKCGNVGHYAGTWAQFPSGYPPTNPSQRSARRLSAFATTVSPALTRREKRTRSLTDAQQASSPVRTSPASIPHAPP